MTFGLSTSTGRGIPSSNRVSNRVNNSLLSPNITPVESFPNYEKILFLALSKKPKEKKLIETLFVLLEKVNKNKKQRDYCKNLLSRYLPNQSALLVLFQKNKAKLADGWKYSKYIGKSIIDMSLGSNGKINEDVLYYYFDLMPKYYKRRYTYYRQRRDKYKLLNKLKSITNLYENIFEDGLYNSKIVGPDYSLESAHGILLRQYKRIRQCSSAVGSYVKNLDVKIATDQYCNSRFCPICAERRKEFLRLKYKELVNDVENPYLLTLTVKNPKELNKKILKKFTNDIKKLWDYRKPKYVGSQTFMKNVNGFVRSVEVTLKNNGTFNLHAHLVVDFDLEYTKKYSYFKIREQISKDWHKITGDSYIVDIKKINTESDFTQAIKYINKPSDLITGSKKQVNSMILTFYRQHAIMPYGNFRKKNKIIKQINEFNSQDTIDELLDRNEECSGDNEFNLINELEKEKNMVSFVACKWVVDGKIRKKVFINEIDSVDGSKWIFNERTDRTVLIDNLKDNYNGIGYCIR